jgi:hypothetical protein
MMTLKMNQTWKTLLLRTMNKGTKTWYRGWLEGIICLKLVLSLLDVLVPPKQRIKLYQARSKLEDILIESQLLDCNLPELGGVVS